MPLDRDFAEALGRAMADAGWKASLPEGELSNPLDITFFGQGAPRRTIIYARRMTPRFYNGPETEYSYLADKMYIRMVFDGDQCGRGARNTLRFTEGAETVLLGFYPFADEYIVAAFDPEKQREYAFGRRLYVKQQTLRNAWQSGIALEFHKRHGTIVVNYATEFFEYLDARRVFHDLTAPGLSETIVMNPCPPPPRAQRILEQAFQVSGYPYPESDRW